MYETWTTKDGREISVRVMTDLHLLNTIKAIEENRIFPQATPIQAEELEGIDIQSGQVARYNQTRNNWLTVLRAEAIRRGLDYTQRPIRRIGLVDYVFEQMNRREVFSPAWEARLTEESNKILAEAGITQPVIDVSNLNNRPSYLHWQAGGTPLKE